MNPAVNLLNNEKLGLAFDFTTNEYALRLNDVPYAPQWVPVTETQVPGWATINTTQTPNWSELAA